MNCGPWTSGAEGVKVMRKLYVLAGTLFVCGLVGCGQDPNDIVVSKTISKLQDTTRSIERIAKILEVEVEAAKKGGKAVDEKKIAEAKVEAENLAKLAVDFREIKGETDFIRDHRTPTNEQREALAKKYKEQFQSAANDLYIAQKKLETWLKEAESLATTPASKSAMAELKTAIQNSQKEFAGMNKKTT
jgi:hypothetical protein